MKKIGIGVAGDADKILISIQKSHLTAEIICYSLPGTLDPANRNVPVIEHACPEEQLIKDLITGRINAAVRGTLPANTTLQRLRQAAAVDHLERIALLETASGKKFLLGPVGVDEGWTVSQKLSLIRGGRTIAERLGLPDRVGVLSGGRYGDIGRHMSVDTSLAMGELVARLGDATHYEILIEEAIRDCGVIIAPDGITGNLIFRTLIFLGSGRAHGAPVVNVGRIFVDTSRASPDYTNALMLADLLAK
jgi:putative methanogen marker protein 4